jgi:hypothetical protein
LPPAWRRRPRVSRRLSPTAAPPRPSCSLLPLPFFGGIPPAALPGPPAPAAPAPPSAAAPGPGAVFGRERGETAAACTRGTRSRRLPAVASFTILSLFSGHRPYFFPCLSLPHFKIFTRRTFFFFFLFWRNGNLMHLKCKKKKKLLHFGSGTWQGREFSDDLVFCLLGRSRKAGDCFHLAGAGSPGGRTGTGTGTGTGTVRDLAWPGGRTKSFRGAGADGPGGPGAGGSGCGARRAGAGGRAGALRPRSGFPGRPDGRGARPGGGHPAVVCRSGRLSVCRPARGRCCNRTRPFLRLAGGGAPSTCLWIGVCRHFQFVL